MRILICEDSVLLREGLVRLLEDAGHTVVAALPDAWVDALTVSGTRDDARASLARMRAAGADCVVLQPVGDAPVQALASLASIL